MHTSAISLARRHPKLRNENGFYVNRCFNLKSGHGYAALCRGKPMVVQAKDDNKNNHKRDSHSFVPNPNESSGYFPEAVLLKEKKVREDGELLPEFTDAEEQELYETLNLQLQSELNVERSIHLVNIAS